MGEVDSTITFPRKPSNSGQVCFSKFEIERAFAAKKKKWKIEITNAKSFQIDETGKTFKAFYYLIVSLFDEN